jgi:hypothetical protein
VAVTQIEKRPRTLPICTTRSPIIITPLLLCLFAIFATAFGQTGTPELELFPKHFVLQPGEQIHYNVCPSDAVARYLKGTLPRGDFQCVDAKFSTEDPKVLRLVSATTIKNGKETTVDGVLEAVGPGRTQLVVRTANSEQRFLVTVAGDAQPPIMAVPHTKVDNIKAREFLFVGHADLDGYDYTAVAKPGIDRVVQEAKKKGVPVVYWVSNEYPNWYTTDRHPDYAFVSEGQEHEIRVDAERVTFTGGSFMLCVLRNVQMTLHGMLKHGAERVQFVFPADAIWVGDADAGDRQWYPTPQIALSTLFARRANESQKYEEVVVPFLNSAINEFPVLGYPQNVPRPRLADLLEGWTIVVRFGDSFERLYRRGDSNKTLLVDFQGV